MSVTVGDVAQSTGSEVYRLWANGREAPNTLHVSDLVREFADVVTDSRAAHAGSLFFALEGERVDGHDFAGAALAAGATGFVVSGLPDLPAVPQDQPPRYLFRVADTVTALHQLAAHVRSSSHAAIIGVTGSIGKTTTKEIIASVLSYKWPVLRSQGNLNTEIGLPLTLLDLAPEHRAAVLEMGMYAIGDIALLARIAQPRIGVVTNVAPIHLERLGTIERIARAKSELVSALPSDGLSILNGDDPWTRAMAVTGGVARSILVGLSETCQFRATDITSRGLDGIFFLLHAEHRQVRLATGVPGIHLVPAFLAAVAVARELEWEWSEIRDAVAAATLDVRQRLIRDRPGMLIIDDSYNAAPQSMFAALELLRAAPGSRIAVLGDMLELGPGEGDAHRDVGERVAEIADWLVVRGPRGGWIADAAVRAGLPEDRVRRCVSHAEAARVVLTIAAACVPAGVVPRNTMPSEPASVDWSVLVKGSRGMEMEEIVERLRGEA